MQRVLEYVLVSTVSIVFGLIYENGYMSSYFVAIRYV